jgi:hypothetical protein
MKLKSIITAIIVASFIFSGSIQAQGLYAKKKAGIEIEKIAADGVFNGGVIERGFPGDDEGSDQGGGTGPGGEPTLKPDPIGGGVVILSLFAGGYAIFRKKQYNLST